MSAEQPSQPSLRDRKKAETRTNIAHAAVELLVTEGPEQTTIARIADAAEISQRTFHNYFPHREAAMFHYMENLLDALCRDVLNCADGQPLVEVAKNVAVGLYFHGSSFSDATPTSPPPPLRWMLQLPRPPRMQAELFLSLSRMATSPLPLRV